MTTVFGSAGSKQSLVSLLCEFWFCKKEDIILSEHGYIFKNGIVMPLVWRKHGKRYQFGKE